MGGNWNLPPNSRQEPDFEPRPGTDSHEQPGTPPDLSTRDYPGPAGLETPTRATPVVAAVLVRLVPRLRRHLLDGLSDLGARWSNKESAT
jgi:hypothetical protein